MKVRAYPVVGSIHLVAPSHPVPSPFSFLVFSGVSMQPTRSYSLLARDRFWAAQFWLLVCDLFFFFCCVGTQAFLEDSMAVLRSTKLVVSSNFASAFFEGRTTSTVSAFSELDKPPAAPGHKRRPSIFHVQSRRAFPISSISL